MVDPLQIPSLKLTSKRLKLLMAVCAYMLIHSVVSDSLRPYGL